MVTDCIDNIGRHIVFYEKQSKKLPAPKANSCFDIFVTANILDLWQEWFVSFNDFGLNGCILHNLSLIIQNIKDTLPIFKHSFLTDIIEHAGFS